MVGFVAFADDAIEKSDNTDNTDNISNVEGSLLLADIPLIYGEECFIERINEKTGGEREPIGLVLSGGSARAFAHIGVLQYLEEQGIYPDYIISNSMGSIVALLYSAGMSPSQILEVVTSTNFGELFDFSIPINSGLLNVSKFKSLIGAYVGNNLKIEDLAIPVMVVCEDMVTKRQVLITEGDYLDVLVASFALPVYFGSVQYNEHTLIDGGIANLVPVNVAYKYSSQVIVSTTFYAGKNLNLKNPITGLNVSIDIGKRRQGVVELKAHPESVWIRCDVEDFSFMDFKEGLALTQRGYASCVEKSDDIARLVKIYNGSNYNSNYEDTNLEESTSASVSQSAIKANAVFAKNLEKKRVSFSSKIPKIKRSYDVYGRIKTVGTSTNFGFALLKSDDKVYSLRNDSVIGLDYAFSSGNFDLKVSVGGAFLLQSYGFGEYKEDTVLYHHVLPVIDVCMDYYIWNHVKVSLGATMAYSQLSENVERGKKPLYFNVRESVQYNSGIFSIGSLPGTFSFTAVQSFEFMAPGNGLVAVHYDLSSPLLAEKNYLFYESNIFTTTFGIGMQTLGWIGSDSFRLFGTALLDVDINVTERVNVGVAFSSRFSFDNKGDIPIFESDGFQLADSTIKAQGTPNAVSSNNQQYIIVGTACVDYKFLSNNVGIAEILLLSESRVGAFCNLLWYNGSSPSVQVGARISTVLGFLGLKDAPLAFDLLYDFSINKVLWKLKIGL